MTFNPNIPTTADKILQSALQLRGNFQTIAAAFASNHKALNLDPTIAGMHSFLTMRPQTGIIPDPVTGADQVALYNKLVTSIPQLFFRPNNSQTPIQLTYSSINTDSTSNDQYSFIAGPFIVYAGRIPDPTIGQLVTLLPSSTLIMVDLTATNVRGALRNAPLSPWPSDVIGNTFKIFYPNAAPKFDSFYIAFGVP